MNKTESKAFFYLDHWSMTKPLETMTRKEKLEAIGILENAIMCGPRCMSYNVRLEHLKRSVRWKNRHRENNPVPIQQKLFDINLKRSRS